MKKKDEMISLNSNNMDFEEKMSLNEVLERLSLFELKSIKAGSSICKPNCSCNSMDTCGTRCDSDCMPDCSADVCFEMSCPWDGWS